MTPAAREAVRTSLTLPARTLASRPPEVLRIAEKQAVGDVDRGVKIDEFSKERVVRVCPARGDTGFRVLRAAMSIGTQSSQISAATELAVNTLPCIDAPAGQSRGDVGQGVHGPF